MPLAHIYITGFGTQARAFDDDFCNTELDIYVNSDLRRFKMMINGAEQRIQFNAYNSTRLSISRIPFLRDPGLPRALVYFTRDISPDELENRFRFCQSELHLYPVASRAATSSYLVNVTNSHLLLYSALDEPADEFNLNEVAWLMQHIATMTDEHARRNRPRSDETNIAGNLQFFPHRPDRDPFAPPGNQRPNVQLPRPASGANAAAA